MESFAGGLMGALVVVVIVVVLIDLYNKPKY